MNRRQARLIRAGIRAARDPKLRQYVHLAPRLVRRACRRELENIERRWEVDSRQAQRAATFKLLTRTGDPAIDAANRATFAGIVGTFPQRFVVGSDPDAATPAQQDEHLRRFYA